MSRAMGWAWWAPGRSGHPCWRPYQSCTPNTKRSPAATTAVQAGTVRRASQVQIGSRACSCAIRARTWARSAADTCPTGGGPSAWNQPWISGSLGGSAWKSLGSRGIIHQRLQTLLSPQELFPDRGDGLTHDVRNVADGQLLPVPEGEHNTIGLAQLGQTRNQAGHL